MSRFFKYHGLGNDFVVLDRRREGADISAKQAQHWCDRHLGPGADGVLVLLPAGNAGSKMVVHNADGSIPEMCGNGIRCAVKYLVDHSEQKPDEVSIETGAGKLVCQVRYDGSGLAAEIQVAMGPAKLVAPHLPSAAGAPFVQAPIQGFPGVLGTAVSMGNPHLVLWDRPLQEAPLLGPKLERAPGFPERTNVEFARLEGSGVEVVVWERGCGLTQACGTGACATVAAGIQEGRLSAKKWVDVLLPGGKVQVWVEPDLSQVLLRGPATFVYEGVLPD